MAKEMIKQKSSRTAITISGTMWNYAGLICSKLIAFITTMVLARLLSQDDFGVAAYASVITGFIDVIAGLGINNSIIYHKEKEGSNDTAFWINFLTSLVICVITFLGAPLVGLLFNDPRAVPVLRVLSIIYPISALGYIHGALLQKNLRFSVRLIPSIVGSIAKIAIAIPMALSGYGVWTIIISQICGELFTTITYWIVLPWKPKFKINFGFIKPLLKYGLNSVLLDVFNLIINQIDFVFVGRILGSTALGIYSMAFRIPELLIQMVYSAVARVAFPVLSSIQDEIDDLRRGFLKITQYLVLIVLPIGVGLALVAEPLVLVFLSEKWLEAIPVIRAISLYCATQSFMYASGIVYKAKGKQNILTVITIFQLIIIAPTLWWITRTYESIVFVAWAQVLLNLLISGVNTIITIKIIQVDLRSILKVILPACIATATMSLGVLGIMFITQNLPEFLQLISAIMVGASIYGLFIYLLNQEVVILVKSFFAKA
jgi:O-antigen/teichoic acid export membrane protein